MAVAAPEIRIDTRPMRRILLERSVRPLVLVGTALLFWFIASRPVPEGLTPEGLRAIAVFSVCLVLWITSMLPLVVTSILAIVLLPLAGVMPANKVYALFGNEAVFFILGVFILAASLMKSRLSTRLALVTLRRFGNTPHQLLVSIYLLNAFMSFFMSEHAVAAMNFPIIMEIVAVLRLAPHRSNYARSLFLSMAWGTTIGGVATLLGGARAPLALGMVRESTGQTFTFLEWALANVPIVAGMLLVGYVVITRFFPIDVASIREADEMLEQRALALGRMSVREKAIAGIMLLTLAGWIVGGEQYGLANVALAAVVALFVFGLVRWRDVEEYVNWGILLMYGGAIALGAAVSSSGAALWMSQQTISRWVVGGPMVVAVPAGLGFTLPIGTPANAIAYSSGYLSIRDMMVPGAILAVSSWVVFNLVAWYYWPLLGIHIGPTP